MKSNNKVELFLDSGAFSAWTQKKEIDIQSYISFIKEHESMFTVYANLDVIGLGSGPNEDTAVATLANQKVMEGAGLHPLPVFHLGEPRRYLTYYIDNYKYLGLGMGVNIGEPRRIIGYLDEYFSKYLCDEEGQPKIKVHGFGVTSLSLLIRYPWYSVDSTSWVITGRMGSIYVPKRKNGKWIYDENSWKIIVSSRSPSLKEAGAHINTLAPGIKQVLLDYIHDRGYKLGRSRFEMVPIDHELTKSERWVDKKPPTGATKREVEIIEEDGISNRYHLRDEINVRYFLDLGENLPKWPWAFKKQNPGGFF